MNKFFLLLFLALAQLSFTPFVSPEVAEHNAIEYGYAPETDLSITTDTLPPLRDRFGNFISNQRLNVIDLKDPPAVEKTVEYDPTTGYYIVRESLGSVDFRPPTYLTFAEYQEYRRQEDQKAYFDKLAGVGSGVEVDVSDPLGNLNVDDELLAGIFGSNEISIQPQGGVDLTFGFNYQNQENPFLIQRQQRNTIFDFDMDIQMNVVGQIGDKLKLNTNYNTGATFNFDNQIKLDYNSEAFGEDDILKKIEAGNVSLPLGGSLIEGAQSLFGIKTELQFGHLRLTAIASQQQSQREKLTIEGGSQLAEFEVYADSYDENRHFFLSHFNRDKYEEALENLPQINSLFSLENIEVWITNDRNEVLNVRDIVAFADLAEPQRLTNPNAVQQFQTPRYREICDGRPLPENGANDLYSRLINRGEPLREIDRTVAILQSGEFDLQQIRDFEKVSARKLNPREYTVHPELGFVSLNINVQPDQVVAVSYRYKYNGEVFKVGELSVNTDNVSSDTTDLSNRVLFTKMLKSSSQRVGEPGWDLMMKNVYSLGAYQVNQEDFRLDVQYDDPGEGFKRFLPSTPLTGRPLIRVLNLDRLNVQTDPQPDGVFDFVPGITINPTTGRVYFPVLEPFGDDLAETILAAGGTQEDVNQYIYPELYDSTLFRAQEFVEKNRFAIRGTYKSSVQSEISLGAFNIPPNSVRVTAGGALLEEGRDYSVDYSTGRVRILNDAILSSGVPINVSFEDNTVFSLQSKTMLGLRADYEVSDKLALGATFLQLFERPFTQKVNLGEDPINNKIYGFDATFNTESGWLTRAVDKLPFYSTSAPSSISLTAETALLRPGHSRAININPDRKEKGGVVYLDDFEGTAAPIDLTVPFQRWFLSSIPQNDGQNNNPLFPEARREGLVTGANRANLSWYRIDQAARNGADNRNIYTSRVPQTEIFPNRDVPLAQRQRQPFQTFDLVFNPQERGPYNFDLPQGREGLTAGVIVEPNDSLAPIKLADPETRWGGIMREMTTNDFQSANIEFVEFWMLSPFQDPENPEIAASDAEQKEGTLYLNLGNISEDILKDSRQSFENGLPGPNNPNRPVDNTVWGRVPVAQQINRGFDNDPATRETQDVGLDGLDDAMEAQVFSDYLDALGNPVARPLIARDAANDNFAFFNDARYQDTDPLTTRYKSFNNTQGNSANNSNLRFRQSSTNLPDSEDMNQDNTLNESESYFQYEVPILRNPLDPREIDMNNTPFITDRIEDVGTGSGNTRRIWYRFRVPVNTPNKVAVGGIQDFRSIRFMRMYMHGFRAQTVLRFGTLELVRNSWRRYTREFVSDDTPPVIGGDVDTDFSVDAVNFEENSRRLPFSYTLPNGIVQERSLGVVTNLQNEQSLSLRVDRLFPSDRRAVFKYTETDLRLYERLKMFVHAEARGADEFERPDDGELSVFIRFGSDFENNFYEYEVPLTMSDTTGILGLNPNTVAYKEEVWRRENEIDFPLALLREIKQQRNDLSFPITQEYIESYIPEDRPESTHTIRIKGNPNLGYVKVFMIGIKNRNDFNSNAVSAEVWLNELRLEGLDERGGVAALARADVQLADLGTVSAAMNYSSIGFGTLDASVTERDREQTVGYDISTQLQMDRFLGENSPIRIPLYLQLSKTVSTPEYDPYDYDIVLQDKLESFEGAAKDSVREQTQEITKITALNLTNVGFNSRGGGKPAPWDPSNFTASYGVTKTERSDPFISKEESRETTAALDYSYSRGSGGYIEPFKKIKSKYLKLLSEFNFNPLPNSISVTNLWNRSFAETNYRFAEVEPRFNRFFNKRFTWLRNYDLQWNLTKSLRLNFNASMAATIDEPDESRILEDPSITDTRQYVRDSIWSNLRNFGRPKQYTHTINASYTLPLRHLPFLNFLDVRTSYLGGYAWNAAAQNAEFLGNIIQNNQTFQVTGDLNFEKFYDQFGFLKKINKPQRRGRSRAPSRRPANREETAEDGKKKKKNKEPSAVARALVRPLLLLRRARLQYSENSETVIPGFAPRPEILGLANSWADPGWGFISGWQPKIRTLSDADRDAANNGNPVAEDFLANNNRFLVTTPFLNSNVIQNNTVTWDGQVTLEPFRDFRIEVNINRTFTENYTQTYKVLEKPEDPLDPDFEPIFSHRVPTYDGSLNMTYGGLSGLFSSDTASLARLFEQFEANRVIISQRLGGTRPHDDPELAARGFSFGYGPGQQDVLLPAFLAAYREEDANSVSLDPFDLTPSPNWRLTYNGLNRVGKLSEIFSRVNISHGFQSTFSINSYGTSLDYLDALEQQQEFPNLETGYDTVTLNFFPRLEIPNISEQKGFAPLVGIEAELLNGMSFNFTYTQAVQRSLNVISKLLSENTTKEVVGGFGLVLSDVNIGFLTGNKRKKRRRRKEEEEVSGTPALSGRNNGRSRTGGRLNVADMDVQFNFSFRDNVTYASKPDQGIREATEGNRVITFSPSVEYQVNNQLS
ncbi:MAG: cell surface protein SprA, partial [Bacteroidota bacterium]